MEAVKTLKANLKLEGNPCGWCQSPLVLGEDASVCTTCEVPHHGRCWDTKAGCATAGCANAPLKRLERVAPVAPGLAGSALGPPAPGYIYCTQCRSMIPIGAPMCVTCRAITSPDGIYHGPRSNAPGAVASLVCGIIGLLICGVVFGPIAIAQGTQARRAVATDPTLTGGGMATAGLVLGIIDLVAWGLILMTRLGGH